MTTIIRILPILYTVIAAIEIASEITGEQSWRIRSKPWLVAIVLIYFLVKTRSSMGQKATVPIVCALVLSWVGDLLLLWKDEYSWTFLSGLGAFFLAHVFYIIAYRVGSEGHFQLSFYAFVPIIGYGIVLYSVLAPSLGEMLFPVAAYSVVLLSMLIAALERGRRTSSQSFQWVVFGAVCFVFSDSILAWHSFVQPSVIARVSLMVLYIAAQFSIAHGMARHITEAHDSSVENLRS